MLALQRGRKIIERSLRVLAQNSLSRTETDFRLVGCLVLIDVADNAFDGRQAIVGLGRGGLGGGRLVASVNCVLVGFGRLRRRLLNALLGAAVHVLNHFAVGGGELIQFVDAVLDGRNLPLHILLAGKRIHLAPKTLTGFVLQGGLAAGGIPAGGLRLGLRLVGRRGCRLLLGEHRKRQYERGEQRYHCAIFHFKHPPCGNPWRPSAFAFGQAPWRTPCAGVIAIWCVFYLELKHDPCGPGILVRHSAACWPALTLRWPKILAPLSTSLFGYRSAVSALWNPKMLTPALTYIKCRAKPEQS